MSSISPIYDIAPPSRTPRRKRSRQLHPTPPFVRIVKLFLCIIGILLFVSTIYLFHLHHAHLSSSFSSVHVGEEEAAGLEGSARRQKVDLANFLSQIQNKKNSNGNGNIQNKENMLFNNIGKVRRQVKSDPKGNSKENLIKATNNTIHQRKAAGDSNESKLIQVANKTIHEHKAESLAQNTINNDKMMDQKLSITGSTYKEIIHGWQKLQQALLQNNAMLLPKPIDRSRTARAFSGLPPDQTPALEGAKRGTISCPDVDPRINEVISSMLAFWNEPRGTRDVHGEYYSTQSTDKIPQQHPFIPKPLENLTKENLLETIKSSRRRYLTFEPDRGGWNNLRISFEVVALLAAVSGRTLVMPPEQYLYLLNPKMGDKRKGKREIGDYYNLTDNLNLMKHVPIISAEEFLKLEGGDDGLIPLKAYNETWRQHLQAVSQSCEERKKSDVFCEDLYDHYAAHGLLGAVTSEAKYSNCLIFDENVFLHGNDYISQLSPDMQQRIKKFCGSKRYPIYYNKTMHDAPVWHFETRDDDHRLLAHFYSILFWTDPKIGNHYKRFVRDFFRYHDEVFCAAGKIILALQYENNVISKTNNPMTDLDRELVGGYSSLHVRRGDLQFKEVALNSSLWYENTKELWKPNEILYIATDERIKAFFNNFRSKHSGQLRFFDDYRALANLDSTDQSLYGMIDTVIASRGSVFAGTWFSTLSAFVVRLRGYYGISKYFSYYGWQERKYYMHTWEDVGEGSAYAREYPTAWTGIDGDKFVDKDEELPREDLGSASSRDTIFPREAMEKLKERMLKSK